MITVTTESKIFQLKMNGVTSDIPVYELSPGLGLEIGEIYERITEVNSEITKYARKATKEDTLSIAERGQLTRKYNELAKALYREFENFFSLCIVDYAKTWKPVFSRIPFDPKLYADIVDEISIAMLPAKKSESPANGVKKNITRKRSKR